MSIEMTKSGAAIAAVEPIGIVITDVQMPGGMDGIDLAMHLRQRKPEIPVIVVSGAADAVARANRLGFTALKKPFRLPAILVRLWATGQPPLDLTLTEGEVERSLFTVFN